MPGEEAPHWGSEPIDPNEPSLPGLKVRFLLERIPDRGRVIELGCGEGKILETLAVHRADLELHGCDVREPVVKGKGYTFHRIQDGRTDVASGSFDFALIVDVLEHVPDPDALLREAARLLRPGGRLIAIVPIEGERVSFYALYRALLGPDTYAITKEHIQSFTHDGLRELMQRYFEVQNVRYAYHPLGQLMDATFFAAARVKKLREFWWKDNAYYNPEKNSASTGARALNELLRIANAVAWVESRWLSRVRLGACAILADAIVVDRGNA